MQSQNDLKAELESTKTELGAKVESLEAEMASKEALHADKVKNLALKHETQLNDLKEKMEATKVNFAQEKTKIE